MKKKEGKKERKIAHVCSKLNINLIGGREFDDHISTLKNITTVTTHRGTFTPSSSAQPNAHLLAGASTHIRNAIHRKYALQRRPSYTTRSSTDPYSSHEFGLSKCKPSLLHRLTPRLPAPFSAPKPPTQASSTSLRPPPPQHVDPRRSANNPPTANDVSLRG